MRARKRFKLTSSRIIFASFLGVVLLGGFLLTLPVASSSGQWTSFLDAVFTAVSATCVTGLVVHDTATFWSPFGQAVILALIQIGGLGVFTTAFIVTVISGSKVTLIQRSLLKESISADNVKGIIRMSLFIVKVVLAVELVGALVLYVVFGREFGPIKGVWYAVFHAISAFCNAGFDLMGVRESYSSLVSYSTNVLVNLVIMALIIIGGIGFYTWKDVRDHGLDIKRYRLQSKISLLASAVLILVPAAIFFFTAYGDYPIKERVLASAFQSVTARTAGFNTTDLTQFSQSNIMLMIMLMLIGGCSGSTAGGMKTTTFVIMVATVFAIARRRDDTVIFQRRIPQQTIRNASVLLVLYVLGSLVGAMLISAHDNQPMIACFFETASAMGTVGLTLGLTPSLSVFSHIILMVLMFIGRIGGLTLLFATFDKTSYSSEHYPLEDVNVG
ncbi:MAG: TrkH family potassium uptake protein [Atopobiaceae bacterium]|jgi:trk system potassium uptake protein TrkH